MAELATIARPYAEAAFRQARERHVLPAWSESLGRLAQVAADPAAAALIGNPNVAATDVENLFCSAGNGDAELANLIHLLSENGRLNCLPEIASQFADMKRRDEGVKEGVIYSAFPMDAQQQQALTTLLEGRFGRLQLSVVIDQELIGGVKVVVGDQVLDTSVSGKLATMRAALNS
jgi:F-type H+-transporting ATPase subunit delta